MFKIIKNFNWIILSSFLCIFMGIVTFLTFINEGFVPLSDKNLQTLLIIDIFLLLVFFTLVFKNFYRFYYTGKKNKKGSQTNLKYISVFSLFTVIPSLVVAIFSLFCVVVKFYLNANANCSTAKKFNMAGHSVLVIIKNVKELHTGL